MMTSQIVFRLIVIVTLSASRWAFRDLVHEPVGVVLTYTIDEKDVAGNRAFEMDVIAKQLNRRIHRIGNARAVDKKQLEVDVYGSPKAEELAWMKRLIGGTGQLEFRILADPAQLKDREIIELAKTAPPNQTEVKKGDIKVAEWVLYNQQEFGASDEQGLIVTRKREKSSQALILIDPFNVTGMYLTSANKAIDERGGPAIAFSLNKQGAQRFERFTSQNKPDPAVPGVYRRLGIVLDKRILSAPRIVSAISDRGMISGGSMSEREVETIVDTLHAGSMPCRIKFVGEKRVSDKK